MLAEFSRKALLAATACLWLFVPVTPGGGQNSPCDPHIEPNLNHPLGYRARQDRCEGIYNQTKSSSALAIASFTLAVPATNLTSNQELALDWIAPGNGEIKLRIDSLRPRLYYRMDTLQPSSKGSYRWPEGIASALALTMKELGFTATVRQTIGLVEREIYVPLAIHPASMQFPSSPTEITVVPGIEAAEIYLSVAPLAADGKIQKYIVYDQPLKRNYYPAGKPINIRLPVLKDRGLYYGNIAADLANGMSTEVVVYFYNSGS